MVDDLDIVSVPAFPGEADAKLIVYADTVLSLAVPLEGFEVVAWDCRKIAESGRGIQFPKLPLCNPFEGLKSPYTLSACKSPRVPVAEALDHLRSV